MLRPGLPLPRENSEYSHRQVPLSFHGQPGPDNAVPRRSCFQLQIGELAGSRTKVTSGHTRDGSEIELEYTRLCMYAGFPSTKIFAMELITSASIFFRSLRMPASPRPHLALSFGNPSRSGTGARTSTPPPRLAQLHRHPADRARRLGQKPRTDAGGVEEVQAVRQHAHHLAVSEVRQADGAIPVAIPLLLSLRRTSPLASHLTRRAFAALPLVLDERQRHDVGRGQLMRCLLLLVWLRLPRQQRPRAY